jgi:GWxTD domain-containing protein
MLPTAVLLCLLCLAAPLRAEWGSMNFSCTYYQSAYQDSLTLVEFNVQFADRGLTFRKDESGKSLGKLFTRFTISDVDGKNPSLVAWTIGVPQPAPDAEAQMMFGSRLAALAPGSYKVQVYYEDLNDPKRRDSAQFMMEVRGFTGKGLQLSDIEIVNEATRSDDTASLFYKNGYLVVPNVASVIVPPFLVLNTYMEVYNANGLPTPSYKVRYMLADRNRSIFFEKDIDHPRPGASAMVELNTLPLDSMPSGDYYIVAKAFATGPGAGTDTAMVFRQFALSNPDMSRIVAMGRGPSAPAQTIAATSVIDPLYAGMQEKELDDEYSKVKFIAKDLERDLWSGLQGADAKARFLTNFWALRDLDPATPENEARENYYKLVEEASQKYVGPMAPHGWESDRGRILLQYGKPDGIERHVQDFNMRPYEIWTYSSLNYEFVFIDRSQTGLYKLMHSTAPHEVRHDNWETDYAMMNKKWENN